MTEDRQNSADRIRRDVLALIESKRDGVHRNVVVMHVFGRTESILATLDELAEEGLTVRVGDRHYPADWQPPADLADRCDRCPAYLRGELCGKSPAECWRAAWAAAGRPSSIPEWEAAARPSRRQWRASGGLFSFDVINEVFWPDSNCGTANGWTNEMCGRAVCVGCVPEWPKLGRCSAPTSRNRLCRNPAARCPAHGVRPGDDGGGSGRST